MPARQTSKRARLGALLNDWATDYGRGIGAVDVAPRADDMASEELWNITVAARRDTTSQLLPPHTDSVSTRQPDVDTEGCGKGLIPSSVVASSRLVAREVATYGWHVDTAKCERRYLAMCSRGEPAE